MTSRHIPSVIARDEAISMPPQHWKTLSTREIYQNKWMRLREDLAEMPNGKTTIYGVCEFGECVGVLPFVDEEHVVMVRQYRYVFGENQRWEMPTGGKHHAEDAMVAAQRELMEEVGYRANQLLHVNSYYTSKSVCQETAHLFIGRDLVKTFAPPDDTEFLEVGILEFNDVVQMVLDSEIRDSMTVIAVLLARQRLETGD